jgi:hypothetical protein
MELHPTKKCGSGSIILPMVTLQKKASLLTFLGSPENKASRNSWYNHPNKNEWSAIYGTDSSLWGYSFLNASIINSPTFSVSLSANSSSSSRYYRLQRISVIVYYNISISTTPTPSPALSPTISSTLSTATSTSSGNTSPETPLSKSRVKSSDSSTKIEDMPVVQYALIGVGGVFIIGVIGLGYYLFFRRKKNRPKNPFLVDEEAPKIQADTTYSSIPYIPQRPCDIGNGRSSSIIDLQHLWTIPFTQVKIERELGRGAYGER